MKKIIIVAAALLLLGATTSFASDEDKDKWPPPPSAIQTQGIEGITSGKMVVAGLFCVTSLGTCPLRYPMWDGSFCTCYWPNGFWSTGYVD